ncbi:lipid-transfer protein [Striga asiatica]|uniref:Lipid-transfer protein n=1 Tax=Striga asiatica TaxID=4170 RepID=A0A5A7PHK3_STRAF|nr:lipid-transfer protein [Striga asiatica]
MGKNSRNFPPTPFITPSLVATLVVIVMAARPTIGQSSSACTGPMISNFGPCVAFLASGSNLSRPSPDCCNSLRDLTSNGQDCLCLIVTGGVPFQVPLNRNLAISLPRACRMSGVPIECKATASPVPTPGTPGQGGPNTIPGLSPPNPTGTFNPQPLTPPSLVPEGGDVIPTLTPPGMRPTLTPSTARLSHDKTLASSLMALLLGIILLIT